MNSLQKTSKNSLSILRLNLLVLAILYTQGIQATNLGTPSILKDVIVYLNGAQIMRTATIEVPVGTKEFVFTNLSPYIQESSIQFSGLKNASILSINYGINYLSKKKNSKEVETLKQRLETLTDLIRIEEDLIAGYNEELSLIQENRKLGNENQVVNLEKLQQFAAYYRKRITEIKTSIHTSEKNKETHIKSINEIKKQLIELNIEENIKTGEIKVKLNAIETTSLQLLLKYNVTNAGWFPIYDLKAEKINSPLQLAYKAHVYQSTGTDWNNINLTLSTNDPNTNNIKPELDSKYLNFISRYSNYKSGNATKNYNYKYNPTIKTISGRVTDESGPLPGVSIIVKGTTHGTETDFDGNFRIQANGGEVLVFSFIGMSTEEYPIHSSVMNVNLTADNNLLEEVVVTALGIKREKQAFGYAVSEVKADNLSRLLGGKAAGVTISSSKGIAGAGSKIKIRGMSSLSGMNNTLFVVDGIPYGRNSDKLLELNPDVIASVEVLKNAAATSLYGTRGANGVVLIQTKSGKLTSHGDTIEEGMTTTRFEIKKKATISSNGDINVIEIDNYQVPASFVYFAAPILNENVFLTAKIGNWEQYNLLPGEANIYFEGSYSGKTNLNPQATTDSLTVSLGVDPNVIIKRAQLNDFKKKSFTGSQKIINKSFEIELKNTKSSAIKLNLVDRIPISQNKEIKIEDEETGSSSFDSKKGILKWTIHLSSKESQKYSFSYTIKYPKYKRVNL